MKHTWQTPKILENVILSETLKACNEIKKDKIKEGFKLTKFKSENNSGEEKEKIDIFEIVINIFGRTWRSPIHDLTCTKYKEFVMEEQIMDLEENKEELTMRLTKEKGADVKKKRQRLNKW